MQPARGVRRTWIFVEWSFCAAILSGLGYAWSIRNEGIITPATGTGYYLGIAGSLMMLSLLLYPLRKHWKTLQGAGSVHSWFMAHAALGVLGPALVVAHSNFDLNSVNGSVAMIFMLMVVASGIVGRYIYSLIHVGMSGRRAKLSELLDDVDTLHRAFGRDMQFAPEIEAELKAYEAEAQRFRRSTLGSFRATVFLGARSRNSQRRIKADAEAVISARALRERWDAATHKACIAAVQNHMDAYFKTVRRAASFHFYERLFGLWHVLHLPLFLLLIGAAVGHVIAVHLY